MASELVLLEVGVMFTIVALVGAIASWIGQSVIPFYIGAGILMGPFGLGRTRLPAISESEFIAIGAELGIVFLLFFLGLEFNLQRLFEKRDRIGKAGIVDLIVNFGGGLILGIFLFGIGLPAVLVAGVVYISSSAIITKSLIDLGWIANREAEPILGILVFEDLVIAVYLAVVSALLLGGGTVAETVRVIGLAVGFIVGLIILTYVGVERFNRLIAVESHEFIVIRVVGITLLIAGIGLAVGVSEAVAAFFVGMAFSTSENIQLLEQLLEPVRDIFAAVFFFWIGLITDPVLIIGVLGSILIAVGLTTVTKVVSGYYGGQIFGLTSRRSIRVAMGMVTRGEFSLIIASLALGAAGSRLSPATANDIYAFTVGYVLVMSILGTSLMHHSDVLENYVRNVG